VLLLLLQVTSLHRCLGALLHLAAVAVYLFIWGVDVIKGFAVFSTLVLSFSFMFGKSVRALFQAVLYVFVQHPCDVGDVLLIDGEVSEATAVRNTSDACAASARAIWGLGVAGVSNEQPTCARGLSWHVMPPRRRTGCAG
jgi:small-conductance mechanosensitive channel